MGQQGAHICDVNFDNVRVPAENRLGEEGQGFRIAMQVLDRGRLHISSVCVGVAERLIEESVRYAAERKQFGQPIANFQMIQAMLADCRAEANAARAMVLDAARKRDAGEDVTMDAAAAKLFCVGNGRAASPTAPCRFSAAQAMSPITASSASTAMCASSASTKAPAKSSASSSRAK